MRLACEEIQELRDGRNKEMRNDVGLGELWLRGEEMAE